VLRERQLFINNIFLAKEVESKKRLESLNRELVYKVDELNTLNRIMTDFTTIGTSFDLFKRVVDLSTELTRADEACFYVINEDIQRPVQVARSVAGDNGDPQALDRSRSQPHDRRCFTGTDISQLILDNCDDDKPLLIHENSQVNGIARSHPVSDAGSVEHPQKSVRRIGRVVAERGCPLFGKRLVLHVVHDQQGGVCHRKRRPL
jgi:hypothetical protein